MRRARHPVVLVSKLCASRLVRGILKSVAMPDGYANFGIGSPGPSLHIGATNGASGRANRRVQPVRRNRRLTCPYSEIKPKLAANGVRQI